MAAAVGVMKYASIIILNNVEKWKMLALLSLRQNIYTEPAGADAGGPEHLQGRRRQGQFAAHDHHQLLAVLLHRPRRGREQQGAAWLAVMDNEGLSVLTAWAAGKFTASKIAQFITESGVDKSISHKELIIPGYVAILSGSLEEKLPGWKITVGPREANQLPSFLKGRA